MSIWNKYNVPKETITQMVKDGVISNCVIRYQEVYDEYKKLKSANPGTSDASLFVDMSVSLNITEAYIKKIVYQMGKKA